MKMTVIILLLTFCGLAGRANSNPYTVNDHKIEAVFNASREVTPTALTIPDFAMANGMTASGSAVRGHGSGEKTFTTALLLDLFLGDLGIHRLYLGTRTITWIGYCLTCGGIFGIVPTVDLIVLIVHHDDISPYIDNPRFFMWSGN